ncbi:MAG: transporter substrate-binding domain-containing protein [Phormidesmis sp.]
MRRSLFSYAGGILTLCVIGWNGSTAYAQSSQAQSSQATPDTTAPVKLTIGVSHLPPFAIETKTENGSDWDGIGVHLWREIAEDLNIAYEWQKIPPDEAVQQVQNGTVDIAITAGATAEAAQKVSFTQSYYISSLGIAQPRRRRLIDIALAVLSPRFLWLCLWLSVLFLTIGLIVWLFERNKEDNTFGDKPVKGLWNSFWWAGVTLTTIGYGDVAPISTGGRIVALLWMLVSMGITASLTASITSVVTQDKTGELTDFASLKKMTVGSIKGSSAAQELQQQNVYFQPANTLLEGIEAVEKGQLDAFVYDAATLQYLNKNELSNRLAVETTGLNARRYAFALPNNADGFKAINAQLLREQDESDWQSLLDRFLPKESQ